MQAMSETNGETTDDLDIDRTITSPTLENLTGKSLA